MVHVAFSKAQLVDDIDAQNPCSTCGHGRIRHRDSECFARMHDGFCKCQSYAADYVDYQDVDWDNVTY